MAETTQAQMRTMLAVAGFAAAAGVLACWLAWTELPHETARPQLNALPDRTAISLSQLVAAREAVAMSRSRAPVNGRHSVAEARLYLASLGRVSPDALPGTAQEAAQSFARGLQRKPNARQAWRGMLAARYVADGPGPSLVPVMRGAYLFDRGDPFTAMTLLEIVLRHPGLLSREDEDQIAAFVPKLFDTWYMRRPLARLYVKLPTDAQAMVLSRLEDGGAFDKWARELDQ